MTKEEWVAKIPQLKRAIDTCAEARATKKAKVWHDNEGFLKAAKTHYQKHSMSMSLFPPNSGDLNPIETVWAWLRRDLAQREFDDMSENRSLTTTQFRQRTTQILQSYEQVKPGQRYSPLQKLVRGMPERLRKARANNYGRCGK